MVHFKIFQAKALLVIAILVADIQTYEVKTELPDLNVVVDFLKSFLKPYFKSSNASPVFRTEHNSIERLINKKIEELMPFLQDFDEGSIENESSNNITLDGDDETTIIEFLPPVSKKKKQQDVVDTEKKDSLRSGIDKYKKMRKKINKALLRESVSEKTQQLVTKTFDKMIAQIIGKQCPLNTFPNGTVLKNEKGIEKATLIARKWNEQWLKFKKQYMRSMGPNPRKLNHPGMKLYQFFEQFHDFLSQIVDSTEQISDKYKIVCQFIERPESTGGSLRKVGGRVTCQTFKLCSGELRTFLNSLYASLNFTAVSTFRNYASMYIRDVNTETSEEKDQVVKTINEISDVVEHKIDKIFRNATKMLKFNSDADKDSKVRVIKRYIHKMIENAVKDIKGSLGKDLQVLGAKQMSITQDLNVNLELDLMNLENSLKKSMCKKFSSCNGKSIKRRQNDGSELQDRNSIYVKVQLNLDNEMKDKLIARMHNDNTMHDDNIRYNDNTRYNHKENIEAETHKPKHKEHKSRHELKHKKHKKYESKPHKAHKAKRMTMSLIDPDEERRHMVNNVTRTTHKILPTFITTNVTDFKPLVPTSVTTSATTVSTTGTSLNITIAKANKTQGL